MLSEDTVSDIGDIVTRDNKSSKAILKLKMDYKLKQARASSKKTQLVGRINDDVNNAGVGKRKMLLGETIPVPKKQNVVGLLSWQSNALACKGSKSHEMSLVYPGDGLRGEDFGKCSEGFEKSSDFGVNVRPDKVTSVRIVDKVPRDFRCTICKELPRLLNRSELYRHYAFRHFYSNLMKEFGHLKTCPVCNVDLKTNSIASHFGQKHSHVEHFLPVEDWIPISKVGANISRGSIGRCEKGSNGKSNRKGRKIEKVKKVNSMENSLERVPLVLPEIPQKFNPDGNERGVKSSFNIFKQPFRIATVNGFDIDLDIDDEQESLVQSSDVCSPIASAHEQVMQCRICKEGFDTKRLVALHVQTTHDMKGSGDEFHDYEALLRSGHIVPVKSMNTGDVSTFAIEGSTALDDREVVESQSLELTTEELELDIAVGN